MFWDLGQFCGRSRDFTLQRRWGALCVAVKLGPPQNAPVSLQEATVGLGFDISYHHVEIPKRQPLVMRHQGSATTVALL